MAPMTTERAIANAVASTNMEGFLLGEEEKNTIKQIIDGKLTLDEALLKISEKYARGK